MKIVIVGKCYGKSDGEFKSPFVGGAGRELARMLFEAKIAPPVTDYKNRPIDHPCELEMIKHWEKLRNLNLIHVTNVFNEFPTNEEEEYSYFFTDKLNGDLKVVDLPIKPGKYLRMDKIHHIHRLWNEINTLKPNLIITMGNEASWAILGETKITAIRGTFKESRFCNKIKTLATYHPAAILRQWNFRPITVADLIKCKTDCEFPEIKNIERFILIRPSLEEIENWLKIPANFYAIDIESGRALFHRLELKKMTPTQNKILNQTISMVGFARDRFNSIVIPFMTRSSDDLNYWKSAKDEAQAWRLIYNALTSNVPKIFQNGMYDISMFLRYKMAVRNATEDTMLLSHSLYPEMPKKLSFLGSVFEQAPSWKTVYGSGENLKKDE